LRPLAFRVPFGESTFLPLGCIHWPIGEKELLRQWVEAVQTAKNGFGLLMGDAFDNARTTFGKHVRSYLGDENSREALDDMVRKEVRDLSKVLMPIRSKLIGAIQGNHFWPFIDGTTSDQYLCQLLKIPYLGPLAAIRLDFVDRRGKVLLHRTLVAHHHGGSAGGRTTSGDVAALARFEHGWDADIYVVSHTHRRIAWKEELMGLSVKGEPHIRQRTKVFVRSGALLKGFKEDSPNAHQMYIPSYAEKAAYRATNLGWVEVKIKLSHAGGNSGDVNEFREDIRVSY
jgi:hypothetical protein